MSKKDFSYFPTTLEATFDDCIAANISFFEGMRGIFAFMVMWDHYHSAPTNFAIIVDTTLFFLLSGFTTSLQLRRAVEYSAVVELNQSESLAGEKIMAASEAVINEKCGVRKVSLKPRLIFDFFSFIGTRLIGLIPLLWFAILLITPQILSLDVNIQKHAAECSPLYVTGMQSWTNFCNDQDPFSEWYVSALLNIFLIYGASRLLFRYRYEPL